jgi:hypothetical protein
MIYVPTMMRDQLGVAPFEDNRQIFRHARKIPPSVFGSIHRQSGWFLARSYDFPFTEILVIPADLQHVLAKDTSIP